jgi:2-methylcitrate dehydratase PrpD
VNVEANPGRLRRGAKLTIDTGGTSLTASVDDIAGDGTNPMTQDQAAEKFRRYTEATLGRQHAEAVIGFILEGNAAESAQKCLLLAG